MANVPLHVLEVTCTDERHQIQSTEQIASYNGVKLPSEFGGSLGGELLPIYALYREAKNNLSPFYRFICYYKILEGVYCSLRPQLFKLAKEKGVTIATQKELVPGIYEPTQEQAALQGKSIKDIFDNRFQREFRVRAAHFLQEFKDPLNVSDRDISVSYLSELSLIEACVRVAVGTHETYLRDFYTKVHEAEMRAKGQTGTQPPGV
jgi:hypothetical protein